MEYVTDQRGDFRGYGHRWNNDGPRGRMGPGHHGQWGGPGMMRDGRGPRHMGMGGGMHMGRGMHMGMGMGMFGPRFMDEIQLTDAQKGKLVDVMTENFRERLLGRIEMMDAVKKLRDLDAADAPNADAIVEANQAMGAARGKMDVLHRKMRDDIRGVLTPEQLQKLDEFENSAPPHRWDRQRDDQRPQRPAPGQGPRPRR